MLCLGVILIANAFSSNLFQTIFYYTPSLGIPLGSIIIKKRTGGSKSVYWGLCNNVGNIWFQLFRLKGTFFIGMNIRNHELSASGGTVK